MTIEAVRNRMSEIDVLYSKLDAIELRYEAKLISTAEYNIKKELLKKQLDKLFDTNI